jgi:dTDP-4-dehydrorhamnose 3,5-epimerase
MRQAGLVFNETVLKGAFVIEPEKREDFRGFFARTYCRREFAEHGLETTVAQSSISFNPQKGTLRGMHYQTAPFEETKLIRCTMGSIYDVIIDLRRDSKTYKRSFAVELSASNRKSLYVPRGLAHGFQTLEDNTEVLYQMSEFYSAEHARGVRWNDSAFAIQWPPAQRIIHERDQTYADFHE